MSVVAAENVEMAQANFGRIVAINEAIKRIATLSHYVRLRAINTLIIAARSTDAVKGFSVISFELIRFSRDLEKMSHRLSGQMHEILIQTTHKARVLRIAQALQRTLQAMGSTRRDHQIIRALLQKQSEMLSRDDERLREDLRELFLKIKETIRLCSRGRAISIYGKIESAYARSDREIYLQLSRTVEQYLLEAEETLKHIQESYAK